MNHHVDLYTDAEQGEASSLPQGGAQAWAAVLRVHSLHAQHSTFHEEVVSREGRVALPLKRKLPVLPEEEEASS